jgi:hypothetical protein
MGWILCGGPPLGPSDLKYSGTELRKKSSQDTREDSSTLGPFDLDADDDGGDGDDCDLEWDLWATDLTRQALVNVSNNNADAGTEPLSTHHHRIRPTASSSTFSSATLSEQALPISPTSHRPGDIVPGANMGLLSVDSPALLTAPSVLPFQSTGVTTSTVSAGGVVRTRSLLSVDGGRGRGVARAMEIVAEDGGEALSPSSKHRAGRRKRAGEENNSRAAVPSASAPAATRSVAPISANVITSTTVTVHESSTPSPTQSHGSPFWEGLSLGPTSSSSATVAAAAATATTAFVPGGCISGDDSSVISGIAPSVMTTTTTTTMIPLLPRRRSSMAGETSHSDTTTSGPLSPKRHDHSKAGKGGKGKGKAKETKSPPRGKPFSPERLVSKLDLALDFVTG